MELSMRMPRRQSQTDLLLTQGIFHDRGHNTLSPRGCPLGSRVLFPLFIEKWMKLQNDQKTFRRGLVANITPSFQIPFERAIQCEVVYFGCLETIRNIHCEERYPHGVLGGFSRALR